MKETIDVLEPILFTNLSEQLVMKAKPSEVIKMINYISVDADLKPKRLTDFNKALELLINQIKNN